MRRALHEIPSTVYIRLIQSLNSAIDERHTASARQSPAYGSNSETA